MSPGDKQPTECRVRLDKGLAPIFTDSDKLTQCTLYYRSPSYIPVPMPSAQADPADVCDEGNLMKTHYDLGFRMPARKW